jgi:RNA polymerase sigma factor (TIGR02999 family)
LLELSSRPYNQILADPPNVTRLLLQWGHGDRQALDALTPLVYDELRRLAARYLRREREGHTLQSTALVHEAYLRLIDQRDVHWQNRNQFFALASELIRRILVDHARARMAAKRGGAQVQLELDEAIAAPEEKDLDLVALDDALQALASADPQQSRIVELRYFAGLTIEQTAEILNISPATVKRDWTVAKAWLKREMTRGARG